MDPLTFHINALTSESEALRVLLAAECFELGIEFAYEDEFGFVSQAYPYHPFKSLASLVMLERIQSWLELDFESANLLMIALYQSESTDLFFVESQQQFSMRMARAIIQTSQIKEVVLHRPDLTPEECQKMSDIKFNPINLKVRMYQAPPSP